MSFGIEKEFLRSLLEEAGKGQLQLPDFQRPWVWDIDHIRSLLATISLGQPAGALMLLQTGGPHLAFKPRPIEGADTATSAPHRLVLDGQQRLTSLYQTLMRDQPIATRDSRGKPLTGWLYIDMQEALAESSDRESCFVFTPPDRVVRAFNREIIRDLSAPDAEFEHMMFPSYLVFDPTKWQTGFFKHHGVESEAYDVWTKFQNTVLERFKTYLFPVIELKNDNDRASICHVFEKVNTAGVPLTTFELATATYAAEGFELRKDWNEHRKQMVSASPILKEVTETQFLQAVTLYATFRANREGIPWSTRNGRVPAVGARRQDMLDLPLDQYRAHAPAVRQGMIDAAKFLHSQHIFDERFIPYDSQLVPLSAILAVLGWPIKSMQHFAKLKQWYWCGVLGELYGGTTETRFSADMQQVIDWVLNHGPEPATIKDAVFSSGRIDELRYRNSAAYKGIYALLTAEALEWLSLQPMQHATYFNDKIDIHHIFPRDWCRRNGIADAISDSIVNKSPIGSYTNRLIGGNAPSKYLKVLMARGEHTPESLEKALSSHRIALKFLQADDFAGFYQDRRARLLQLVADAMGKPVAGDTVQGMPALGGLAPNTEGDAADIAENIELYETEEFGEAAG